MTAFTGANVDGKIRKPVRLAAAEEDELTDAMEQIRLGQYIEAEELLDELRSRHPRPGPTPRAT